MSLPRHRRWIAALVVVAAAAGITTLAFAQSTVPVRISATATVTPNKAGTPKHPQGVRIGVKALITIPDDYDPPLVNTVDVWFPRGGKYNGAKYAKCSQATMARKGIKGCPPKSIMGHGTGNATADTVITHPDITVVNGGRSKVFFFTVLRNPARVALPVPGSITKVVGDPKWSYKLHTTVPAELQVVAGIPIKVSSLNVSAGHKPWAPDWLATTYCPPSHRWVYRVKVTFTTGAIATYDGSAACR